MGLDEFVDEVMDAVLSQYGSLTVGNVIVWLDNNCFLSDEETEIVVRRVVERMKGE